MPIHPSWKSTLSSAYLALDPTYRHYLETDSSYFPTQSNYLSAFATLPRQSVRAILFGQDPYPRVESAIGYAFIDGRVGDIFSPSGLSRDVNKASSLRNFIKMALVARGDLSSDDTSQEAIARVDKSRLIKTMDELRVNFEAQGVLLLNTALIFSSKEESKKHIKAWQPFIERLLAEMRETNPSLILFGTHAKALKKLKNIQKFETIEMEHPYNHSFITNPKAHKLFGAMNLLAN